MVARRVDASGRRLPLRSAHRLLAGARADPVLARIGRRTGSPAYAAVARVVLQENTLRAADGAPTVEEHGAGVGRVSVGRGRRVHVREVDDVPHGGVMRGALDRPVALAVGQRRIEARRRLTVWEWHRGIAALLEVLEAPDRRACRHAEGTADRNAEKSEASGKATQLPARLPRASISAAIVRPESLKHRSHFADGRRPHCSPGVIPDYTRLPARPGTTSRFHRTSLWVAGSPARRHARPAGEPRRPLRATARARARTR